MLRKRPRDDYGWHPEDRPPLGCVRSFFFIALPLGLTAWLVIVYLLIPAVERFLSRGVVLLP